MDEKTKQEFENDMLEILCRWGNDEERQLNWKTGSSVSHVFELMVEKGWQLNDFEYTVEKLGFKIVPAKTKNGFHKWNRVITI